jgi:hypothetical protein
VHRKSPTAPTGLGYEGGPCLQARSYSVWARFLRCCPAILGPPVGAANGWCAGCQASGQGGGIYITTEGVTVFLHAVTVAKVTGNSASDGAAFDNIVGPYTLT